MPAILRRTRKHAAYFWSNFDNHHSGFNVGRCRGNKMWRLDPPPCKHSGIRCNPLCSLRRATPVKFHGAYGAGQQCFLMKIKHKIAIIAISVPCACGQFSATGIFRCNRVLSVTSLFCLQVESLSALLEDLRKHPQARVAQKSVKDRVKEEAQKQRHFAKRSIELKQNKMEAEERKARYMKETGGLQYTALAMANRK